MSAQALQRVREHLQVAQSTRSVVDGFDVIDYRFDPPLDWLEALIAIQLSAHKGWACELKRQVDPIAVTMLRLIRPANFSASQRAGLFIVPGPENPEGTGFVQANAVNADNARFREVNSLLTLSTSLKRKSEQPANATSVANGQLAEFEKDVEKVCSHFSNITGKKPLKAGEHRVRIALGHWSVEKLCQALDVGVPAQRDLLGNTVTLQELFKTLPAIAKLLDEPVPKPKSTWLTPYAAIYRERFPKASFSYGAWGKVLKPLEELHGPDLVQLEFRGYLAKTEASFLSAPKFAGGFGSWVGKANLTAHDGPVTSKIL